MISQFWGRCRAPQVLGPEEARPYYGAAREHSLIFFLVY